MARRAPMARRCRPPGTPPACAAPSSCAGGAFARRSTAEAAGLVLISSLLSRFFSKQQVPPAGWGSNAPPACSPTCTPPRQHPHPRSTLGWSILLLQRQLRALQARSRQLPHGSQRREADWWAKEVKKRLEKLQLRREGSSAWGGATNAGMLAAMQELEQRADAVLGSPMEKGKRCQKVGVWVQGKREPVGACSACRFGCKPEAAPRSQLPLALPLCSPHGGGGCALLARAAGAHCSAASRPPAACAACSGSNGIAAWGCLPGHAAAVDAPAADSGRGG